MQRLDNRNDRNLLTAEFTTGQLIAIICVSLFVAMVCFGLGILIGRADPPQTTETTVASEAGEGEAEAIQEMETYTTPAFGTETGKRETSAVAQPSRAQRTPESPPPRSPFLDNTPRLTALPPLTPYRSLPVEAEAPTRISNPEVAKPQTTTATTPAATTPVSTTPPAAIPELTPIDPIEPPVDPAPAATPKPEPAKPAVAPAPAKTSGKGKFGVQLAAFSGSDRRARAESFLRKIRTDLKVEASIIPSSDDVHYRVISGSYPTREAANAACAALKRKSGLSEAFVRPL